MKKTMSILIVGMNIQGDLIDTIYQSGYLLSFINSMEDAIKKIRYEKFSAILFDRRYEISIDILEFILNVRDFNSSIPVYIIGKSNDTREDQILIEQQEVYIIDIKELSNHLKKVKLLSNKKEVYK